MCLYRIYIAENDSASIGPILEENEEDPIFEPTSLGREVFVKDLNIENYYKNGTFYDWLPGWSWAPFTADHVHARLFSKLVGKVQWIGPFYVDDHGLFLFNCTNLIDCAKNGSNSNKLIINDDLSDELIFRPIGFEKDVIITESLKQDIETAGDTGIRFGKILEDGWIEHPF